MTARPEWLSKKIFRSGRVVPTDGMYGDLWGSWLPLLEGDLFPLNPEMGETKWTYKGPLGSGLPELKRAMIHRQAKEW